MCDGAPHCSNAMSENGGICGWPPQTARQAGCVAALAWPHQGFSHCRLPDLGGAADHTHGGGGGENWWNQGHWPALGLVATH